MIGAVILIAGAALATHASPRFGYDYAVRDMPVLELAMGLTALGLLYALGVPALLAATLGRSPAPMRGIMIVMIAAGLAARLVLIPSEPMLEDDYQRYLWDGAVTAAGLNPYAASPQQAKAASLNAPVGLLAAQNGLVLERIGHANLKTIYPPVAQAGFALAHAIAPWNLTAWKLVLLCLDVVVLWLILALLGEVGRSPLWAALYWWNPIALKEIFNSGHMEPLVMVPVLLAIWLAVRGRNVRAMAALGVAAGAKLWPVLLVPLVARPLLAEPRRFVLALGILAGLCALSAWPILAGGLDATSGFLAYAAKWRTNSALLPALEQLLSWPLAAAGLDASWSNRLARGVLALVVLTVALGQARSPMADAGEVLRRAGLVCATIVLLAPAQYPWYALWFMPLLPFLPLRTFLVLTVTLPLYYLFFHFNARSEPAVFHDIMVWLIWLPAWGALWFDWRRGLLRATTVHDMNTMTMPRPVVAGPSERAA